MKNILYIIIATIAAAACGGNGQKAQLVLADAAKADSLRTMALQSAGDHYRLMILTDMWNEKKAEGKYREATELAERLTTLRDTLALRERMDSIKEKQACADMAACISEKTAGNNKPLGIGLAMAIIALMAMATISFMQHKKRGESQIALAEAARAIKELAQRNTALAASLKSMETESQENNAAAEELKKAFAELERHLTQENDKHKKRIAGSNRAALAFTERMRKYVSPRFHRQRLHKGMGQQ